MPAADLMSVAPMSESAPPQKTADDPFKPLFDQYMEKIQTAANVVKGLRERDIPEAQARQKQAEAVSAQFTTEVADPSRQALKKALDVTPPPRAEPEPEPPVPPKQGRPFMDVPAKNALQATVQTLGLMAQLAMAGRAPVAALGALTGAMRGWTAGDHERAENEWQTYLQQVDQIRVRNRQARELWLDDTAWANGNVTRFRAKYVVDLAEKGQFDRAADAARMDAKEALAQLDREEKHIDTLFGHAGTLIQSKANLDLKQELAAQADQHFQTAQKNLNEQKRLDRAERAREADQRIAEVKAKDAEKRREKDELDQTIREQYTPDVLRAMGIEWITERKSPALGFGGAIAQEIRGKAYAAGMQWAREQGIDPSSIPAVRAEVAASKSALLDLEKRQSQIMSFVNNFDSAVELARKMSKEVGGRTNSPVIDRYIMKLRGEYEGDPQVAALETQLNTVALEYAKVMVGNAQGDASTRADAREKINIARNDAQLNSIFDTLRQDTVFRRKGYDTEKQPRVDFLKHVGGGLVGATSKPALPPGTKMEGGELVSESGKYVWRNGAWQSR
jgi:hypothetical protein